jgi:intracellular multiplication protein IcmG
MADNEQLNDEYQFADLDGAPPDPLEESSEPIIAALDENERTGMPVVDRAQIIRNSMIVVGLVIVVMIVYKVVGSVESEKQANVKHEEASSPLVAVTPILPEPVIQQEITKAAPVAIPVNADITKMEQKLSALDLSQQSVRQDVATLTDQVNGINNNLTTIAQKLSEITNAISSISARLDAQAHELEVLTIHREAKRHHDHSHRVRHSSLKYHIQAVIPGRAWLIASNGSTLTVREGTVIAGVGMVKLIDPAAGRVVLSSGHVIKFSQEDS